MTSNPLHILSYHAITAGPRPLDDFCFMPVETFRAHMRWLRASKFDVLPLKQAAEALAEGRLRRRSVALTFDDGFRNNVSVALPVLEEFGLPATIFLSTGLIDSAATTWAGRVTRALIDTRAELLDYAGTRFALSSHAERVAANRHLQRMVKAIAPADPGAEVAQIEALLGACENPDVADDADLGMLRREDIEHALATGLVSFGGHSVTHPILSALGDAALKWETQGSVAGVEALTQSRCETFAYPNGQPADYDDRAVALLRGAGVTTIATTTQLANESGADPLSLSRWVLGGAVQVPRLRATLIGLHPNQLKHRLPAAISPRSRGPRTP